MSNIWQQNHEGHPQPPHPVVARAPAHTGTRAQSRPRGPGALLVRNMTGQVSDVHPRPWTPSFGEENLCILIWFCRTRFWIKAINPQQRLTDRRGKQNTENKHKQLISKLFSKSNVSKCYNLKRSINGLFWSENSHTPPPSQPTIS